MSSVMAWLPWTTRSKASPTGMTSETVRWSRWSTRSCCITFSAVRSRCMADASVRSVDTKRRREGIGTSERGLVGSALPALGADAVEQHVPHGWRAVDPGERLVEGRLRSIGDRLQEPLLGDVRQVVVAEGDGAEAALLVAEGRVESVLLGTDPTPGLDEVAAQVELACNEGDERDRAGAGRPRRTW